MLRALYSAATGMESQQLNLDVISNNLANVNTTGFKKSKIEFQDLLYQEIRAPGAEQGNGDQLPTVKEAAGHLAINPNTVLKAYKELEHAGLAAARPGIGTFVTTTLNEDSLAAQGALRQDLQRWLEKARRAGLDDESIEALFEDTFRSSSAEGVA